MSLKKVQDENISDVKRKQEEIKNEIAINQIKSKKGGDFKIKKQKSDNIYYKTM